MGTMESTGNFKGIDAADVAGKRVLVRADLNVPCKNGVITDATRIERFLPTVKALVERGAKVIILSHLGRPDGEKKPEFTLRPVAEKLAALVGKPVKFVEDCIGPVAEAGVASLANGEIAMLENLRYYAGEEKNDPEFVKALAAHGDVFVNDGFSVSHRAHASVYGIALLMPAFAGNQMQAELNAFKIVLDTPKRPVAAIVGGAKVSTKIPVLTNLVSKVDMLFIGGGMANTFLHAQGVKVGKSLCEPSFTETVDKILAQAAETGCKIVLPSDGVVAKEFAANAPHSVHVNGDYPEDGMILDIGPKSLEDFIAKLKTVKTLMWNGPVGAFETTPFGEGTFALAKAAAELTKAGELMSVGGGGDTVAALNAAGVTESFSYVSTAGGAFLELLEGRELPGVVALTKSASK